MSVKDAALGRLGERRKVPLTISIDRGLSESLHKIKKGSVSNLINSFLDITIKQFDPGPLSPLIYDLHDLLKRHLKNAAKSGDCQKIACITQLESQLLPYYELAEVSENDDRFNGFQTSSRTQGLSSSKGSGLLTKSTVPRHDYSWYSVPRLCHGVPMVFSRRDRVWTCSSCGTRYPDD